MHELRPLVPIRRQLSESFAPVVLINVFAVMSAVASRHLFSKVVVPSLCTA